MNDLNWIQVKIHNELPSDLCPVFSESDRSEVRPFTTNTAIQCKAYPSDLYTLRLKLNELDLGKII